MSSIYGLYDAAGALRYIGKANDPAKRLRGHLRDARRRRTPLYDWISKHGEPELRVLEADCADWRESERRLIAEARARGERLLNVADGGDEPHCPIEVRRENGRTQAKGRNAVIWRLLRRLGADARYFADRGDTFRADRARGLQDMIRGFDKAKRARFTEAWLAREGARR